MITAVRIGLPALQQNTGIGIVLWRILRKGRISTIKEEPAVSPALLECPLYILVAFGPMSGGTHDRYAVNFRVDLVPKQTPLVADNMAGFPRDYLEGINQPSKLN